MASDNSTSGHIPFTTQGDGSEGEGHIITFPYGNETSILVGVSVAAILLLFGIFFLIYRFDSLGVSPPPHSEHVFEDVEKRAGQHDDVEPRISLAPRSKRRFLERISASLGFGTRKDESKMSLFSPRPVLMKRPKRLGFGCVLKEKGNPTARSIFEDPTGSISSLQYASMTLVGSNFEQTSVQNTFSIDSPGLDGSFLPDMTERYPDSLRSFKFPNSPPSSIQRPSPVAQLHGQKTVHHALVESDASLFGARH